MRKRVALFAAIGVVIVSLAGLRGCPDLNKPIPWAAAEASRYSSVT